MKREIIIALVLALALPASASAWTKAECPTRETHPDCEKFFPPEQTPTPTPTPTPPPEATPVPTPPPVAPPVTPPTPQPPEATPEAPTPSKPKPTPNTKKDEGDIGTPVQESGGPPPQPPAQVVKTGTLPYTGAEGWIIGGIALLLISAGLALRAWRMP